MDLATQSTHFANDLEALIDRYRCEYDLMLPCVVGVMTIQTQALIAEHLQEDE